MIANDIQLLIEESSVYYAQRQLDKALTLAEQALAIAEQSEDIGARVASKLLIGQIHTTSGKYLGQVEKFQLALRHLQEANMLHDLPSGKRVGIDIQIALGEVYENKRDFQNAAKYYQRSLEHSQYNDDVAGIIRSLCKLCQLDVQRNEFGEAIARVEEGLAFLKTQDESTDEVLLAQIYNQLASIHLKRQEYSRILEYSEPLLRMSRSINDIELELNALNNMAIYYGFASDYKSSMQYLLEALDKSKNINFRKLTAQYLINMGTIYASLFNYEEAIEKYQTALDDYEDVLEDNSLVILYNNIGNIHSNNNLSDEAEPYFQKALDLAEKSQYKEMIAHSIAQLSRTEVARGRIDESFELAQKARQMMDELGDVNGRQINLSNLSRIYYHRKEYPLAIKFASSCIVTSKRMKDDTNELRAYQLLADIYKDMGDFAKALQYQMAYSKKHEQFAGLQMHRQVIDMEIKYAIREKQQKIEQLTKENKYQSLLLEQSDQITKQNSQLLQANEELRQFAYVASHDLKEPLRMIGSYTQLIHRLHGSSFNEDSNQYFAYVKEGVIRMNNLLDALLKYATIGKTEEDMEMMQLNDAVDIAIINLRVRIEETEAEIERVDLPAVRSSQSLLIQLFQNLLSNAIKFHKPNLKPVIKINCEEKQEEFVISIKDNGIGIDPDFQERIFVIFQRLHTRNKYEGTGIGLAICQKIIQRLNGRIWISSKENEGATFFVALPKSSSLVPSVT
ncbi:MAG: tetratricopeptide repeat protein [Bacteroidota bacterium]